MRAPVLLPCRTSALLAAPLLLSLAAGCSGGTQAERPTRAGVASQDPTEAAAAAAAASISAPDENDRMDAVRRVCARKANSSMPRCWNAEYERTHNRKIEAQVEVLIVVSPGGTAEDVKVIGNQGSSAEMTACVAEEVRSWTYPEGTRSTPVNCRFVLRSTM